MKSKLLVFAILAILAISPVTAQTVQEIELDEYLPRNPIANHVTKALTGFAVITYSGAGTTPVVGFATPTLTIGSSLGTYSFDTNGDTTCDTAQELVASISSKTGWSAALGDQFKGTEGLPVSTVVDLATTTAAVAVNLDLTRSLNYGAKLYMAGKTACLHRIIWTNTFTGACNIKVYKGTSADSNTADTVIFQGASGATTVEKEIDLTPYQIQGAKGGYLKVFIEAATTQTSGSVSVITLLGSYK